VATRDERHARSPADQVRRRVPENVFAVVLTLRRRRLAGDVVRSLIDVEGFDPTRIVVVVNGEGGLDDPELERRVRMLRLSENFGPAAGFGAGLQAAFADPDIDWAYLCEDDVGLFALPVPRVADVLERAAQASTSSTSESATAETGSGAVRSGEVGAIVAYGRTFTRRGGHTENTVPPVGSPYDLGVVDVACWGATLVARPVITAGILPDPDWFFGYEDFDFFCRLRAGGFSVVVDAVSAAAVADQQTSHGRALALGGDRPVDGAEAWRAYYVARNFFAFARRHGRPSWLVWHLAYSVRRLQRAGGRAERVAYLHGLVDGARGRLGRNPRFLSTRGELPGRDATPDV
jgi:GT2 family glycosyltransferase